MRSNYWSGNEASERSRLNMSINMYLEETDGQTEDMNQACEAIIQSMEEVQFSISSFSVAFGLKGKTYDSAKSFMTQTYFPLAQGFIYLCEELMEQHSEYPRDFKSSVASTDVVETEVIEQISEIEHIIQSLESVKEATPLISISIRLYEKIKYMLTLKLERLYVYNERTANNYETAINLAEEIKNGIEEIENGKGFNTFTGTFSTDGMDLDWATNLSDIHYGKRAEEEYGDYLDQFSEDKKRAEAKNKVMDILKYEDTHPEYVEQTNEFLSPLNEEDIIELKHLMYNAEEPYRTLSMEYLDRFEIVILTDEIRDKEDIKGDGVFRHWEDNIYLEIENLRDDKRGMYYTYFHEVAHAFDYYYAQDNKEMLQEMIKDDPHLDFDDSTFTTDVYKIDNKTLTDHMYNDAENSFREYLGEELESSKYKHLSTREKLDMVDNVTENLLMQNDNLETLSKEEVELQKTIQRKYKSDILNGPDHNTASDVYSGVTNRVIEGSYFHDKENYWLEDDGTRNREPNKEGFAEYYGRIMSPGDGENHGVNSVEEHLSGSKGHMDEVFERMGKE